MPEFSFTLDEVCERICRRHEKFSRNYSIVVIAEGAIDKDGVIDPRSNVTAKLGRPKVVGVGPMLAREIKDRLGCNARSTTLGYLQRSAALRRAGICMPA